MNPDAEKPKLTPSQIKPGMKFNHWTVLKFSHKNKHRIPYFLCKCDCGTVRAVRGTALIQGTSRACSRSCENNIIGQRFGRWTVLRADKSRPRYYWCRCDCGTERSIYRGSLISGQSKSCGCLTHNGTVCGVREETIERYKSCIGKKYGKLTVLELNDAGGYFLCQCDCGKQIQVPKYNIVSGNTTSCGCTRVESLRKQQQEKYEDCIGKKINHLTITDCYYKNNSFWFTCICDCGKEYTNLATRIYTGYIQSCGCLKSKAEEDFEKILQSYNISYIREYKISDCCDKQPLPFDFAILNSAAELIGLVELNGKQHYSIGGWQTEERLKYVQKHDKIKIQYCLQNNIPLLVIPYQYYDSLEEFLTTSDFWQVITRNFND